MAKITTLKEFESIFPKLAEDILDHAKQYKLPEEFVKWFKAVRTLRITLQHQADQIYLVHVCEHSRWKMQSWNVRSRLRVYAS